MGLFFSKTTNSWSVYFCFPETSRKRLEDIDTIFQQDFKTRNKVGNAPALLHETEISEKGSYGPARREVGDKKIADDGHVEDAISED